MEYTINYIVLALLIILPLVILFPVIRSMLAGRALRRKLQKIGLKGMAKVLSVTDTGVTVNEINYYVKIDLEVVETKARVTVKEVVSRTSVPRVGDTLKVLYNPSNPQEVVIV